MKRDCLQLTDLSAGELRQVLELAAELKAEVKSGVFREALAHRAFACIFHKPSLRTRLSFEVGLGQLGGRTLFITDREIQLGQRESIHDVAQVLSRYVAGILIRTFEHAGVEELARHADVPVVNMLTDLSHPCQVLADIFTVQERLGRREDLVVSYFGDGNNVVNSWLNLSRRMPMELRIATAANCLPDAGILEAARREGLSKIVVTQDPRAAAEGAHVLYTDVWASMGEKERAEEKMRALKEFHRTGELLSLAREDCVVLHCLPAERGREITDEVMDGPRSAVFDEAENRLHAQKALLLKLLEWSD